MIEEAFNGAADIVPIPIRAAAVLDEQNDGCGFFGWLASKMSCLAVLEQAKA